MRIKHRNLEQIRKNPQSASQVITPAQRGKTMVRYWDWAVANFHKEQDAKSALAYLINGFSNFNDNRANNQKQEMLIDKFNNYLDEYNNLNFVNIKTNSRLNIDIQHKNSITGEVFRIDKTPENGFAIALMSRTDDIWVTQLRFPLLQIYYSNYYKCPYDLIKVGIYNFEKEIHEYTSFEELELNHAWEEIIRISSKINQVKL